MGSFKVQQNGLIFTFLLICLFSAQGFAQQKVEDSYTIKTLPINFAHEYTPYLPDLSTYTIENIEKKIPANSEQTLKIINIKHLEEFRKFTKGRALNLLQFQQQNKNPRAIALLSGVYTMEDIYKEIADEEILERSNDEDYQEATRYILKLPLYIGPNATLVVRGTQSNKLQVALSSDKGSFIINRGKTFVLHGDIYAWDDKKEIYQKFTKGNVFRPFWFSQDDSETYFSNSVIRNLGYASTKAYGITFSVNNKKSGKRPTGWIINSRIEGLYYGFYSYEADDVVIYNNDFADNIYYAIDPHDRSERLIIANNMTHGTKVRHGIIISRDVNNSYIINNKSYRNNGTGIMIDRNCRHNIVHNNASFDNKSYGLAVFESPDNVLSQNVVVNNSKHGFRVRNSWNIKSYYNSIIGNGGDGVNIQAADVSSIERIDPFVQKAELEIYGGIIADNTKRAIGFDHINRLALSNVTIPKTQDIAIYGHIELAHERLAMEQMLLGRGVEFVWKNKRAAPKDLESDISLSEAQ